MAAAEYLLAHPEIPHGPVKIGFTPDEEVGRGTQYFDVNRFGARFAYTLDGPTVGDIEIENFSADAMTVTFKGFNAHPGYAKGRMVSAIKLAAEFVQRLPRHGMSPETTEGYEGYVHPHGINGGVERASVKLLLRDFATKGLDEKARMLTDIAEEVVRPFPSASIQIDRQESYRNMKEVLDRYPDVIEHAKTAMARAGITPRFREIRGGTDGARLSFMGLPTPNLFAGEHNIHSRLEWTSVQDMDKAVQVIVEICRSWAESGDRLLQ
jgi:tripeptide aminopeptidase